MNIHMARAQLAWPMLVQRARNGGQPFTYSELCDAINEKHKTDLHYRAAWLFLGVIRERCKDNGLPRLQALVVNGRTRVSGKGYAEGLKEPPSNNEHNADLCEVKSYNDWPNDLPDPNPAP